MKSDAVVAKGDAGGLINEASILSEVVKVKCNDLCIAIFKILFFQKTRGRGAARATPGSPKLAVLGRGGRWVASSFKVTELEMWFCV